MQKARFFCPALKTLGRYTFLLWGPTKILTRSIWRLKIWKRWKRSAQARSVDIFITRLRGHGRRCSKRFGLIRTVCRHILLRSQNLSDSTIKSLNFKDIDLHIVGKTERRQTCSLKRPIEILWHFGVWLWTGCKKEEFRWTNSSGNLWNFRWLGWRLNCNGEIELNCGGGRKLTAGVQQFLLCLTKRGKRGRRDCSERAGVLSQVWETTQILQIIISCLFLIKFPKLFSFKGRVFWKP